MRRLCVGAVVAFLVLTGAGLVGPGPAMADTLSVSVDIPVVYSFSDGNLQDASASGILIGVQLPLFANLGLESYQVSGQAQLPAPLSPAPFEYDVLMVDLFLELPFPAANLVLGAGLGQGKFDTVPASGAFGTATLTQLFFSLGIPFAGVFDGHVGYHRIFGEADIVGSSSKVNLDAGMATAGVKLGF